MKQLFEVFCTCSVLLASYSRKDFLYETDQLQALNSVKIALPVTQLQFFWAEKIMSSKNTGKKGVCNNQL